jgi:hypothetical protein
MKTTHKTKDRRTRTPQNTRGLYVGRAAHAPLVTPVVLRYSVKLLKFWLNSFSITLVFILCPCVSSNIRVKYLVVAQLLNDAISYMYNRQVVVHTLVIPVVFPVVYSLL